MRIATPLLVTAFIFTVSVADVQEQNTHNAGDSSLSISQKIENIQIGNIYPNPFCVGTFLSFTIEKDDSIRVELFDILGTPKGIILNSFLLSGPHSIALNEGDLKPGIYFLKFTTPDTSIIVKAVFLK